jgi:hypothetical protein
MAQPYMLVNEHDPEGCEPMEAGLARMSDELRGKEFYCTCPFGRHGYFLVVEADSAQHAMEIIPPEWRAGTTALPLEIFKL